MNKLLVSAGSVKAIIMNVETGGILEPITIIEMNKRIYEKSFIIYTSLQEKIRNE